MMHKINTILLCRYLGCHICVYTNVFPEELPGTPPDRDVEFVIELQPGTAPISRRPYRMTPRELTELKIQLQDLVDKGLSWERTVGKAAG